MTGRKGRIKWLSRLEAVRRNYKDELTEAAQAEEFQHSLVETAPGVQQTYAATVGIPNRKFRRDLARLTRKRSQ